MSALANEKELHSACKSGDHEIVKFLLEANTRATTFANNGYPPFIVAASHGHTKCIELLLHMGKGIRVDMTTRSSGDSALSIVCGAYRSFTPLVEGQSSEQHTSNSKAREAKNNRLLDTFYTLLNHNADMASARRLGATPLHIAATRGFLGAVKTLLPLHFVDQEGRRTDVNVHYVDSSNRTPLHLACMNGHAEVASVLLQYGADPLAQDKTGASSLHNAIFKQYQKVVCSIFHNFPLSHNGGHDEQKRRLDLLQVEVKRKISIPVTAGRMKDKSSDSQQTSFAVAQDNAQLIDILLRGPDCLATVIRNEIYKRPEIIAARRKRKKQKRKRRREERRLRAMRKRLGLTPMGVTGNATLDSVDWEEEAPEPKSKPEIQWLYQDSNGTIVGPISSSRMRGWYQEGKLSMELLVYKVPEHEGSALTDEPPPPSILNMPARGQGPYALGPVWDPKLLPHKQRHMNMKGKFKHLRVVLTKLGGPKKAFGTTSNFSAMLMTKMMASKWRKQSKGTKKHLNNCEYDSDESSGLEDIEPEMSIEEMEEERMHQEKISQLMKEEYESQWIGSQFVQQCDLVSKRTPLATACGKGWYDTARILLESGKCKLEARDRYGFTPLCLASKKGYLEIVKIFITTPGF